MPFADVLQAVDSAHRFFKFALEISPVGWETVRIILKGNQIQLGLASQREQKYNLSRNVFEPESSFGPTFFQSFDYGLGPWYKESRGVLPYAGNRHLQVQSHLPGCPGARPPHPTADPRNQVRQSSRRGRAAFGKS